MAISFIKFIISGAVNTGITYLIFLLSLNVLSYGWAYSVSYVSGIIISYLLCSSYVFKQKLEFKKFFKFPIVYIVQYFFGFIFLKIVVEKFMLDPKIGIMFVIITSVPITFFLSKFVLTNNYFGRFSLILTAASYLKQ